MFGSTRLWWSAGKLDACSALHLPLSQSPTETEQLTAHPAAHNDMERKTPMAWQQLLYNVEDRVATITLNRPDRLNAYTQVMAVELREAFAAADADEGVRAIVLTGAGRGFCAGADMERLSAAVAGATDLKTASYPTEGLAANFAQSCSYIL